MQATFAKREMLATLGLVVRVADKSAKMPMLSMVHLEAKDGELRLRATDLYRGIEASVKAEKVASGSAAIPAHPLLERIKSMPDGPLVLTVDDNGAATIKGEGKARKFVLRSHPGKDFPPAHRPDPEAPTVTLATSTLAGLIDRTFDAISGDDTRPHLASLLFEWDGDTIRAVSTDGHRLHFAEIKTEQISNFSMLIPRAGVLEIRRLCDTTDKLTISRAGSTAFFAGDITFSVKLVDAQFPPYSQVIPKASTHHATVDSRALQDIVKAVLVAAPDRTGGISLSFSEGAQGIAKAESPDGGEAEDTFEQEGWKGEALRLGVSGSYVATALKAAGDVSVTVGASGDLDPLVFSVDGFKAVVMPMRLS